MRDLPNADYGEGAVYRELQEGAPLAQSQGAANAGAPSTAPPPQVVPMSAPSQQPGVPVTSGVLGPGAELMGQINQPQEDITRLTPYLPVLAFMADQENASWATRNLVRRLKSSL